jgi:hypothetical protein
MNDEEIISILIDDYYKLYAIRCLSLTLKIPKKKLKNLLMNYYDDEILYSAKKITRKQILNCLEKANRFLRKIRPSQWKKDEAIMKKIGW